MQRAEIALKQSNSINNEDTIHRIRNRGAKTRSRTSEHKNNRENCSMCNFNHERNRMNCPARDKKCFKCNNIGHFNICCRNLKLDSKPEKTKAGCLSTEAL